MAFLISVLYYAYNMLEIIESVVTVITLLQHQRSQLVFTRVKRIRNSHSEVFLDHSVVFLDPIRSFVKISPQCKRT